MPQSLSRAIIHIVFSTKNREELIVSEIEDRLFAYLGTTCNDLQCKTIKIGGYLNHVHILCHLHRTISQAQLIKTIKAYSSKWIKTMGDQYSNFYWQDGYAVYSVSFSEMDRLIKYIENQKEHHTSKSFQEEYIEFLKYYNIDYDEKYMWD